MSKEVHDGRRAPAPPPGRFYRVLDEFWHGPREPRARRAVPRRLDGLYFQQPEGKPTAESKRAALDAACANLDFDREALLAYCAQQDDIRSAAFYGSILREDFLDSSDVDILLDCENSERFSQHRKALETIFERPVDVCLLRHALHHWNPVGRVVSRNSKRTFYQRSKLP